MAGNPQDVGCFRSLLLRTQEVHVHSHHSQNKADEELTSDQVRWLHCRPCWRAGGASRNGPSPSAGAQWGKNRLSNLLTQDLWDGAKNVFNEPLGNADTQPNPYATGRKEYSQASLPPFHQVTMNACYTPGGMWPVNGVHSRGDVRCKSNDSSKHQIAHSVKGYRGNI